MGKRVRRATFPAVAYPGLEESIISESRRDDTGMMGKRLSANGARLTFTK